MLSFAINVYVYVTVHKKFDAGYRVAYSKNEEVRTISELKHPLVRNALIKLGVAESIEITSIAEIPSRGSGLGSSSAFTVGLLNALHSYNNDKISKLDIAEQACDIEIEMAGEPIGKQDQYASALGGINYLNFNADESVSIERIQLTPSEIERFFGHLLLFYTGITRDASPLLAQQQSNARTSSTTLRALHIAKEHSEIGVGLLKSGEFDQVGNLLDIAWHNKRKFHDRMSNTVIDENYRLARSMGALGGKLLGAGGGGFMMLYAAPEKHEAITKALSDWRRILFALDLEGTRVLHLSEEKL